MSFQATEPGRKIIYNNEEIPKLDSYVYLGVELNSNIDFERMSKHKVQAGVALVNTIGRSLTNQSMPMTYKQMLIKGLLLPRISYGIDIYRHNDNNLRSIKAVINGAIRLANRARNVCTSAFMDELNAMPLEAIGRYMALKNAIFPRGNDSLIKRLYETTEYHHDPTNMKRK